MTRKDSRPPKKRNTHRKKSLPNPRPKTTFSVEVTITSQVVPHVRVYKGVEMKLLARCHCEIAGTNETYSLFIDREKYAQVALRLKPGQVILLTDASFMKNQRFPRITELHTRRFVLPSDSGWMLPHNLRDEPW